MLTTIFGLFFIILAIGVFAEGLIIPAIVLAVSGTCGWLFHSWWPLTIGFIAGWAMRLLGMDPGWNNSTLNPKRLFITLFILSYFAFLGVSLIEKDYFFNKQIEVVHNVFPNGVANFIEFKLAKKLISDPALKSVIDARNSRGEDITAYGRMSYRGSWSYVSSLAGPFILLFAMLIVRLITYWAKWVKAK